MASREQLEDWTERWLKANQDAEQAGDWKPLADFYTEDATYGWNIGPPKEDVMCIGRDEIRDVALGLEMEGLENWVYEYQKVLIDEKQNEIVASGSRSPTSPTAAPTRSTASAAAGSGSTTSCSSNGSATSSTSGTCRRRSWT